MADITTEVTAIRSKSPLYGKEARGYISDSLDKVNDGVIAAYDQVAALKAQFDALAPLGKGTVTSDKMRVYWAAISSGSFTLDLATNSLAVERSHIVTDVTVIDIPAQTVDFSAEMNNQPTYLKFFYLVPSEDKVIRCSNYGNGMPTGVNIVILFSYYAGRVDTLSPERVSVIGTSGRVSPIINLKTGQVTEANIRMNWGWLTRDDAITFDVQNKTLSVNYSLTYIFYGQSFARAGIQTIDISEQLARTEMLQYVYLDLSDPTYLSDGALEMRELKMGDYNAFIKTNAVLLFTWYNKYSTLTAMSSRGIKYIDESGQLQPAVSIGTGTVSKAKMRSVLWGGFLGNGSLTLNLQTRILTVPRIAIFVDRGYVWLTASEVEIPEGTGTLVGYVNNVTGTTQVKMFWVDQAVPDESITVLFAYYSGGWTASTPSGLRVIDASGNEIFQTYPSGLVRGAETNNRLILPDTFYLTNELSLPIYSESIVADRDCMDFIKLAIVSKSTNTPPEIEYFDLMTKMDAAKLQAEFTIHMKQSFNRDYQYYKDVTLQKKSSAIMAGKSPRVLNMGDSITEGGVATHLMRILTDMGATPVRIGTYNNQEGRGSWTIRDMIGSRNIVSGVITTRMGSGVTSGLKSVTPWLKLATAQDKLEWPQYCYRNTGATTELSYESDTNKTGDFFIFDVAHYFENHSTESGADFFTIQLGTNDLGQTSGTASSTLLAEMTDMIAFMVKKIFEALPNCKVALSPNPTVGTSTNGNGVWKGKTTKWIERQITLQQSMRDAYPGFYIIPGWCHMNPDYTFPYNDIENLSEFNDSKKGGRSQCIHYDAWGYIELCNAMAAWIVNTI